MRNARIGCAKKIIVIVGFLTLAGAQRVRGQVQVGDDLSMRLNGLLTGGYSGNYGDAIPSNHGLNFGGSADLNGVYYNPNFINFSVLPYYNQSRADSNFQSLTDATGVVGTVNLFNGSHFPGFATYHFDRNSTGTFGLVGTPNFTTVGNSQGFGVGWSALIPDWPTLSVSYSQGSGNGTIYGTNELSNSSTKILNVRSSYLWAGWRLNANYDHLSVDLAVPYFLSGGVSNEFTNTNGSDYGVNGNHALPWNGSIALAYNHSSYSGDFGSTGNSTGQNNYTTNQETANAIFHPTSRLGLYASQSYIDNLTGFFYQNIINGGGGIPLTPPQTSSNSVVLSGGASYNFTKNLYGLANITYFDQNYLDHSYNGSYLTGTVGYAKKILDTFTVSATVIESTNKFTDNSLGFIVNLNAFRHFGPWEFSGGFSYAQNVQTYLVTYTTSYYNYNANLHRRLGHGMQWTGAFNGSHSGFSQQIGTTNHSEGFSTSLSLRRISLSGNYTQSYGQSILTSSGIQPITTPGLPPEGIILYNGKAYGAGLTINPLTRLTLSANYSYATSDTLSGDVPSNNRTEVFYSQLQYRLRQITVLAGYTKFSQGISASGIPPANEYSYFIGVTRSFNFF
jgi:hypothetical protein